MVLKIRLRLTQVQDTIRFFVFKKFLAADFRGFQIPNFIFQGATG
jgi:hypothetical protein